MMYHICVNRPVVNATISRKLEETLNDRVKSMIVADGKILSKMLA